MHALKNIVLYTTNTWISPLATLRVFGPVKHAGIAVIRGNDGEAIYPEKVSQAEIVLIQRDFPRHGKAYNEILKRAHAEGKPVVFDLDDLLLELPEDHPDRLIYYYSEALLPILKAIIEADLVTASTLPLCNYLRPFNPNVRWLPNYLDDQIWSLLPPHLAEAPDRPVVIGYMGGDSHTPDLRSIAPALLNIARRFGDRVFFRFLGARAPDELMALPNITWDPVKTLNYAEFAADFLSQDYDIALAPLRDNLFNRCKSAIKFLEYSALAVPGVYSRLETYTTVVIHGENGFLASTAEEWEDCLSRLIDNPDLRHAMGLKAQETVRQGWLLSQHAHEWVDVYNQMLSGAPTAPGNRSPELDVLLRLAEQTQDYQRYLKSTEQTAKTRTDENKALVEQKQQIIEVLTSQLAQQKQALQTLAATLTQIEVLTSQLAQQKQALQTLAAALTQAEADRDSFSRQLWAIEHGSAWQRVLKFRRLRARLSQPAGLPGAVFRTVKHSLLNLKIRATRKPSASLPSSTPSAEGIPPEAVPLPAESTAISGIEFDGLSEGSQSISSKPNPSRCDVIVFPVMDWSSRVQRPQQIAMQFARAGHRVFYLNTAFREQPVPLVRPVYENIYEVQMPSPKPVNLYREAMDATIQETLARSFTMLKSTFDITHAVCLVDLPFWMSLALRLRHEHGWKIVYDCMDYHQGFATNTEAMLQWEDSTTRESDLVLVTSHLLLSEKTPLNQHCLRVPNGADFDHFRFPALEKPPEIAWLNKPVIGYYGAIADWFDTELIRWLALARPEWNFVLIGSTQYANLEPLMGLGNVYLLGEKAYQALPPYLHTFDVAIIPFKKTPLTEATNPVKLFEYLSAGKAIVATDLNELRYYANHARLASSSEEWLSAIEAAMNDYSPERVQARQNFARQNTWETRFVQIKSSITMLYPKVSVIVLTYNNLDYTRLCLGSIFAKTDYPHYEVIVVDNASTDGTPAYLRELAAGRANLHLILNEKNEGFARGNNQGAGAASGEILVFLNNDTVVTGYWLTGLSQHLRDYDVGMIGPVTNWSGNETRIKVDYPTLNEMDDFAAHYTTAHAGQSFEIPMLAFLCVAIRRPVFEEIGQLDESFGLGMFEDDDYARRLRAKGYRIICAEDVFIHHWGSASFSLLDPETYQRLFEENRRKLEAKWGLRWEPHQDR